MGLMLSKLGLLASELTEDPPHKAPLLGLFLRALHLTALGARKGWPCGALDPY